MPRRYLLSAGLTLGLAVFATAPVYSQRTQAEAMDGLADDIQRHLNARKEKSVYIPAFRGVGKLSRLSSGADYARALEQALRARRVEIRLDSKITILGEFEECEDDKRETQVISLKVVIKEPQDKQTTLKQRFITDPEAVAQVLGLVFQHLNGATPTEQTNEMKRSVNNPSFHAEGTLLRSKESAKFAIEIFTAANDPAKERKRVEKDYNEALVPRNRQESGLAFVQFKDRSVYAVRLINEADYEVAVALSIDGLSMFVFSDKVDPGEEKIRLRDEKTDQLLFRHVLVPAAKDGKPGSILVRGWFINLNKSDEFEVTSYAKSAAKELQITANIGTITAIFHAAWKPGDPPPDGEPKRPGSQAPDVGTRKGARYDQICQVEERRIGLPRGGISVRYER